MEYGGKKTMSKLFISGGTVIDPETLSRFQADVLCEDGRIAAVQPAQSGAPKDARVIDASGCFVCPGFIDPHGHIDGCKYTGTLSPASGHHDDGRRQLRLFPAGYRRISAQPDGISDSSGGDDRPARCARRRASPICSPRPNARRYTRWKPSASARCKAARPAFLGPGYAPGTSLEEMEALCTMARRYGRPAAIDTRMFAMTDLNSLQRGH